MRIFLPYKISWLHSPSFVHIWLKRKKNASLLSNVKSTWLGAFVPIPLILILIVSTLLLSVCFPPIPLTLIPFSWLTYMLGSRQSLTFLHLCCLPSKRDSFSPISSCPLLPGIKSKHCPLSCSYIGLCDSFSPMNYEWGNMSLRAEAWKSRCEMSMHSFSLKWQLRRLRVPEGTATDDSSLCEPGSNRDLSSGLWWLYSMSEKSSIFVC